MEKDLINKGQTNFMNTWKIEFRSDCKTCGGPLPNARHRTFCSKKCRVFYNNQKQLQYNIEWHKNKRKRLKNLNETPPCNADSVSV